MIKVYSARTFIVFTLILLIFPTFSFSYDFAGGTGEANDPYQIETAAQLLQIDSDPNLYSKCFILINDINLDSNLPDVPVFDDSVIDFFTGSFDGNDHSIVNLFIDANEKDYIGLFGHASEGEIKDLKINNSLINGKDYVGILCGFSNSIIKGCDVNGVVLGIDCVGGIAGESDELIASCNADIIVAGECCTGGLSGVSLGQIYDCNIKGSISGQYHVGGIFGSGYGHIKNCTAETEVSGTYRVGGLIGMYDGYLVEDCCSSGSVNGIDIDLYNQSYDVGGLIGSYMDACGCSAIKNCSSDATVTGSHSLGGLIGHVFSGTISSCYSTGIVEGVEDVGGLIGVMERCQISSSYSQGSVSGEYRVGGLIGWSDEFDTIQNCFSTGTVTGEYVVGALIGCDIGLNISASFWDIQTQTSDINDGIGNIEPDPNGVIGLPTEQMQIASTFIDAGWDFVGESANGTENIWRMCINGIEYPKLYWEFPIADLLCPDGVDFLDYARFSDYWLDEDCADSNDCEGADFDLSGSVDTNDLKIFTDFWLEE